MPEYITKTEYLKDQATLKEERLADFKETKKERHSIANKTQTIIYEFDNKMDENITEIALLKQSQKIMINEFKEHKQDTKDGFNELKELIKGLGDTFATKSDHKINSDKIKTIQKALIGVGIFVLLAVGNALLDKIGL